MCSRVVVLGRSSVCIPGYCKAVTTGLPAPGAGCRGPIGLQAAAFLRRLCSPWDPTGESGWRRCVFLLSVPPLFLCPTRKLHGHPQMQSQLPHLCPSCWPPRGSLMWSLGPMSRIGASRGVRCCLAPQEQGPGSGSSQQCLARSPIRVRRMSE